jgi:hypothetical protein
VALDPATLAALATSANASPTAANPQGGTPNPYASMAATAMNQGAGTGAGPAPSGVDLQALIAQMQAGGVPGADAGGGLPAGMTASDVSDALSGNTLNPGVARRTAQKLNVPLPQAPPPGPPPTPNAMVPRGPPPTPNAQVPQGPPPTPQAPVLAQMIDPRSVMEGPLNLAAALGKHGDGHIVHAQTGDTVVPAAAMRDILRSHPGAADIFAGALGKRGRRPEEFQVGNRAQSINPDTGLPQFGFNMDLQTILPLIAAAAGSMFVGPELLAPALASAGMGASTAGFVAPILASTALGTGATLATNPNADPLKTLAMQGVGAGVGQAVGSLFPNVGSANEIAGKGVGNPLAGDYGPPANTAIVPDTTSVGAPLAGDYGPPANTAIGQSAASAAASTAVGASAANQASQSGIGKLMSTLMPKGFAGTLIPAGAGMIAGDMVGGMFPKDKDPNDPNKQQQTREPQLASLDSLREKFAHVLNPVQLNPEDLRKYGTVPQNPPYRFFA